MARRPTETHLSEQAKLFNLNGSKTIAEMEPALVRIALGMLRSSLASSIAQKEDGERVCDRLREYHNCRKLGGGKQVRREDGSGDATGLWGFGR